MVSGGAYAGKGINTLRPPASDAPELVLINTAGGDMIAMDITIEDRARAMITTLSSERIYHLLGANAVMEQLLTVRVGGRLDFGYRRKPFCSTEAA